MGRREGYLNAMCERGLVVASLGASILGLSGCSANDQRPSAIGEPVAIERVVEVPAGRAHATFQGGRPVGGGGGLAPYCELEIATVSEQPQRVAPVRLRVHSERHTLLKDPITRIPAMVAGFDCSDALAQESIWYLNGDRETPVRFLRCLAPYFNCRIGPPLSLAQAQAVVGPSLRLGAQGAAVQSP